MSTPSNQSRLSPVTVVSWTLTTIACLPVYLALIVEFVNDGFRWTEYPGDLFTFGCFGFGYVVWIPINAGFVD